MARKQQDTARTRRPARLQGRQAREDRWWEVRDPQGQLVWVTVYSTARLKWFADSRLKPATETPHSRGSQFPQLCPDRLSSAREEINSVNP
jgi:hypothetical protein